MNRRVSTEEAEEAVRRIRETSTLAVEAIGVSASRPRLQIANRSSRIHPSDYVTLPHVVAVAEEFSRRILVKHSEGVIKGNHRIHEEARRKIEDEAEGSWPYHREAWKRWHQIILSDAPDFDKFDTFIEARNSIMHGLGRLTRRQTREDGGRSLSGRMKKVGITVVGGELVLGQRVVARCSNITANFVVWLDLACQRRFG